MKFTYVMSTTFTKLKWFFHNVSLIINTVFPPLRGTPYAGRVKLFAEALRSCHRCPFHHPSNDGPTVWVNVFGILNIHYFRTSVNLYGTGAFCSKKFTHHALLSTCYCVERTWLTETPVILLELDSVVVRWVRQGAPPGATFKGKK